MPWIRSGPLSLISIDLTQLFVDFKQAFDLIWRYGLWNTLLHYGIPSNMVSLIRNMYERFRSQVQTVEGTTEEFQTSIGVLQGCILAPHMFNLFLHCVMSHVEANNGAMIEGIVIDKLVYAYDIVMLAGSVAELQTKADNLEVFT